MDTQTLVNIATIASPVVTLIVTVIGWLLIISDSRKKSSRAEVYDMLNSMIKISLALNQRSAEHFLKGRHLPGTHQSWVASVSVEISSLRAISSILKELHSIEVPDEFFYSIRKTYTLNAEGYHKYTPSQAIHKISTQNTQTSRSLKTIYALFQLT